MGIFQRLFHSKSDNPNPSGEQVYDSTSQSGEESCWEPLPAFIPAAPEDIELISILASAIAAGDYPDSQFVVKKVWQRNPEVKTLSLIAASIAAGERTDSQLAIKAIYQKKN
ncbi:hypothetical protein ACVR1G_07740 [Streptococcus dentasini]